MKFWEKWRLRRRIKKCPDPHERSGLIYEYVRLSIAECMRQEMVMAGEFEIVVAMMMANVASMNPNRKSTQAAFARIEKLAREYERVRRDSDAKTS